MQLRHELTLWMVTFLSLFVAMSFGTIQLMARMTPAIERILQENVFSVTAVEEMLAAIADRTRPEQRQRFAAALEKAQSNITESEEVEILKRIESRWEAALAGDAAALSELTHFLSRLGEVNRASMHRANEQAKRLGWAGAWAAVMLGFCGFLISLYAMRRLGRKFLSPLEEIHSVLHAFGQGDRFRRCTLHRSAPEFREAGETINQLLDRAWSHDESAFQTR